MRYWTATLKTVALMKQTPNHRTRWTQTKVKKHDERRAHQRFCARVTFEYSEGVRRGWSGYEGEDQTCDAISGRSKDTGMGSQPHSQA